MKVYRPVDMFVSVHWPEKLHSVHEIYENEL